MIGRSSTEDSRDGGVVIGSVFGYLTFVAGLLVWGLGVPITAVEKVQGIAIPAEAGLLFLVLVVYAVLSGVGVLVVRASLGGRHLATRVTVWAYAVFLVLGIVVALLVNSS